mgnify:CR=1 FL=1
MFFLKLIKPKLSLFEFSKYNLFNIKDLYDSKLFFYLNGSSYYESRMNYANNPIRGATNTATISINLSVGDYVEMYGASNSGGSARSFAGGSTKGTSMGGYKLTTW